MTNKKILMVVAYKARDLEGNALVGYYLKRQYGIEVIYTNGYHLEKKILKHAPDAVVLDHLGWDFKGEQARLAKRLGMKVIVLPTEGLFQEAEDAARVTGAAHNANHLPDCYLAWGNWLNKTLLDKNLMIESQVYAVGCPRFDFYRQPYLNLMKDKRDLLKELGFKNPDLPLILWTTNTTYAARNPRVILKRYAKKSSFDAAYIKALLEDNKRQFRDHSKLVLELAKRRTNWNFIIKIHPAEWVNGYIEMERQAENIKLAYNCPVRDYLYHSDILLQRYCTTATEGWMFNKPVLNLDTAEYPLPVREEYTNGNHSVADLDETDSIIQKYLDGMPIPAEQQTARDAFISDFYFKIDGRSAERCASLISKFLIEPEYDSAAQARKNKLTAEELLKSREQEDSKFVNKAKDFFGIERNRPLRFWKKMLRREMNDNANLFVAEPEITSEMVAELENKFDALLGHKDEITQSDSPIINEKIQQTAF